MRKPALLLAAAVLLPLLAGCFTVVQAPLPTSPAEVEDMGIRGVVLGSGDGEQIVFDDIQNMEWTEDEVSFVGDQVNDGSSQYVTRSFPISSLAGVMVRQLDAGRTSAIVGGVIVGATVVLAVIVSGSFEPDSGS